MKTKEGVVGISKFVVRVAEVWVSWEPHLQLVSEMGKP